MIGQNGSFQKAIPVWEAGKTHEMNQSLIFEVQCSVGENAYLRIAGHTGYRVFVNGKFCHFGPARAGRGCYRVEEIPLCVSGKCIVSVFATGYYCRSFYWLREPSFVCAEIVDGEDVIAYTGDACWKAYDFSAHVQKVQRYSYQRTFSEVYDFRKYPQDTRIAVRMEPTENKRFLAREMTVPTFDYEAHDQIVAGGTVADCTKEKYYESRYLEPSDCVDAFLSKDLDVFSLRMAESMCLTPRDGFSRALPYVLNADSYLTATMAGNRTGLIELAVDVAEDTDLFVTFDELLYDGNRVDFLRMGCSNVVMYRLAGGCSYQLLTAEPYTLGAMNIIVRGGRVTLRNIGMRRVGFDRREIVKSLNPEKADDEIARIYHAAEETFCQNTFDIYMDCPSRERAGWLCDSFFTARVEHLLTGKSTVERAFLSNFAMVDRFDGLPEGMLPMCYPSDPLKGEFIPNWAMWFVLELQEYHERTGDHALVATLREKMYALLGYFRKFENVDGLLERLENWVFVEWSRCNDLVQDINYPTNMLYYRFKKALSALYNDAGLSLEAEALRLKIREQSKIGLFFCDNAVYNAEGTAVLSGILTETCQYYAFYMGIANREEDALLWNTMVDSFGPERKLKNRYPDVHFSNAFIGNYLRLDLLAKAGLYERLEENIRGYFNVMAQRTDTLWENDSTVASCNHGFASHVLIWLDQLGYLI